MGDLDDTIRQIRSAIFSLQAPRTPGRRLRDEILGLATESAASLGFEPHLRLEGPVDSAVGRDVGDHLLAVLREALSNVVRHAGAARVDIAVVVGPDGAVMATVVDDGVGPGTGERAGGQGLANIARRAEALGGSVEIGPGPDGGGPAWPGSSRRRRAEGPAPSPCSPLGASAPTSTIGGDLTRDGMAELDRADCLRRLAQAGVGRVSTTVGALPTIFPVNYALLDDDIVFRTDAGTNLAAAVLDAVIAFEIDDIDPGPPPDGASSSSATPARSRVPTSSPGRTAPAQPLAARGPTETVLRMSTEVIDGRPSARRAIRAGLNAARITDLRP